MATRGLAKAARLGLETWIIFNAAVPALILLLICLFSIALPWVPDPYLFNFGTGDAVLLAGLLSIGVAVEIEAYIQLSGYSGGRLATWKNIALGTGIIEFVAFGACKVYGLYVTSGAEQLAVGKNALTVIADSTIAGLLISLLLGLILKFYQIEDAICVATKQVRP